MVVVEAGGAKPFKQGSDFLTFGLNSYPPDLTMSSVPLLLGDFNPFVLVAARNKSEE